MYKSKSIYKEITLPIRHKEITLPIIHKEITLPIRHKEITQNYNNSSNIIKNVYTISKIKSGGSKKYLNDITQNYNNSSNIIKNVYIISNIKSGGSKKYLNDITQHYTHVNYIYINAKKDLDIVFLPYDILFVQQLLFTDILPIDLINIKIKYHIKIIISVHDYCWFTNTDPTILTYQNGYLYDEPIDPIIINLFNHASIVIHPFEFTKSHYISKGFPNHNILVQCHNDIITDYSTKYIPGITNQINIGNIAEFSEYKGSENIILLKKKYSTYKGYTINFFCEIKYNENNWFKNINDKQLHCLLHLNKFGETYSYCLSKSINLGLPILYNNIGAFKERIPIADHYIKVIDNETDYDNHTLLYTQFEKMLDYIIRNNGLFNKSNNNNTIHYKDIYNYIFEQNDHSNIHTKIHKAIKPFAIYFPQFHPIIENNINYYNGMTDITNLNQYNNNNKP